jgi:hypothetical protein
MPDESRADDLRAAWREQPEETHPVNLNEFVNRRTHELYGSTRAEILASIGAALFFVAIMAWRLAPPLDRLRQVGFGAVIVWVLVSLWWFRRRLWRREPARPDAAAASGLEYYRKELEARRGHLRNAWIWHGPLVLACLTFVAGTAGKAFPGVGRLLSALPLVLLLVVWIFFGLRRRWGLAQQIQREIDEMDRLAASERGEPG